MSKKVRVFYIIAGVLAIIVSVAKLFALNVVIFNLFGFNDILNKYIGLDLTNGIDLTITVINMIVAIYFNISCARLYFAISRASVVRGSKNAVILMPVLQMLLGSVLSGLFGLIGALLIDNKATNTNPQQFASNEEEAFFDIKLSVLRLKELKESGQISEDEYYRALNKILEK